MNKLTDFYGHKAAIIESNNLTLLEKIIKEGYPPNDKELKVLGDLRNDFSECDIYAMQSLLYNEYNSLTLCGDLMQRLAPTGITSWERLSGKSSSTSDEAMWAFYGLK